MKIRKGVKADVQAIKQLYTRVAETEGGIARISAEITTEYIESFLNKATEDGVILVVESDTDTATIIGEIHCYTPKLKVFTHVLSELTIVVDPNHQGQGIGRHLFSALIEDVEENHSDILRIELFARESNEKAIRFYEKLGFTIEGRFVDRIMGVNGLEADIAMAWFNHNYQKI